MKRGRKPYPEELQHKAQWFYLSTSMSMRAIAKKLGVSEGWVNKTVSIGGMKKMMGKIK